MNEFFSAACSCSPRISLRVRSHSRGKQTAMVLPAWSTQRRVKGGEWNWASTLPLTSSSVGFQLKEQSSCCNVLNRQGRGPCGTKNMVLPEPSLGVTSLSGSLIPKGMGFLFFEDDPISAIQCSFYLVLIFVGSLGLLGKDRNIPQGEMDVPPYRGK